MGLHEHDIWLWWIDLFQFLNEASANAAFCCGFNGLMEYHSIAVGTKSKTVWEVGYGCTEKGRGSGWKTQGGSVLEDANGISHCEWVEGTVSKWEFYIDPDTQSPCGTKDRGRNITCYKKKEEIKKSFSQGCGRRGFINPCHVFPVGITPFSYTTNLIKVTSPSCLSQDIGGSLPFPSAHKPTYAKICVCGSSTIEAQSGTI